MSLKITCEKKKKDGFKRRLCGHYRRNLDLRDQDKREEWRSGERRKGKKEKKILIEVGDGIT